MQKVWHQPCCSGARSRFRVSRSKHLHQRVLAKRIERASNGLRYKTGFTAIITNTGTGAALP